MSYVQILVEGIDPTLSEILIAELSALDFEGFEEIENGLKAFIPETNYKEAKVNELSDQYNIKFTTTNIEQQNWNALWESNFDAVIVHDFCEVRAEFHFPSNTSKHEVIITPKMSFGTGHHATTYMMIEQMRDLDFKDMAVADFGTGTGVLAILAEKLGSKEVLAIDHDDWSIENAKENFLKNKSHNIILEKTDSFSPTKKFDIILANINKNVIIDNLDGLVFGTKEGGYLLISGILKPDEEELINAFKKHNFCSIKTAEKNNWISILLKMNVEKGRADDRLL